MDDGTEALRCLAPCWNLAGDDKLLNILQNTHQNIVSKCNEVNTKLGDMAAALNNAAVTLQNVNNRFMSLSNKQFIESRVYDDDVDVASDTIPVKEPPQVPAQESHLDSLRRSLQVLERTHDSITILEDSDTDSGSEDDMSVRTVLRPKDVYRDRPLPYIIGSQQWKNKWHAGLVAEDSDSESDSGKPSERFEQYSDSEPELAPPSTLQPPLLADDRTISETSSELPSDQDQMVPAEKQRPSDVAAELARRLGGHLPQMSEPRPDIEPEPAPTKLYKPPQPNTGPIFSDEPPPLDSSSSEEDIFAELHKKQPYTEPQPVSGLFAGGNRGDLSGEEDEIGEADIFTGLEKTSKTVESSYLSKGVQETETAAEKSPYATTDDVDNRGVKKPVGGISLFGTNKGAESIGAAILKRNMRKSSTSGDESESDAAKPPAQSKREVAVEKTESEQREKDIFDDLFAKAQKVEKVKPKFDAKDVVKALPKNETKIEPTKVDLFNDNIFDDIDDIFINTPVKIPENTKKSIFDDNEDLFSEIAAPKPVVSVPKVREINTKGLFESDDELFADNTANIVQNVSKSDVGVPKEVVNIKNEPVKSIFDDNDDDDLFSDTKNVAKDRSFTQKVQNTVSKSNVVENKDIDNIVKPRETKVFNSPSLFDDDDDDDTDLFAAPKPSQPSKMTADRSDNKGAASAVDDSFITKKETVLPKIEQIFDNKLVEKTDNTLNSINIVNKVDYDESNIIKKPEETSSKSINRSPEGNKSHSIKDSIKKPISDEESDFEQDFDDLPPRKVEKSEVNSKIDTGNNMDVNIKVIAEIKSDESKADSIFNREDNIFATADDRSLEITVPTRPNDNKFSVSRDPKNALFDDKLDEDLFTDKMEKPVETSTIINNMKKNSITNEDNQNKVLTEKSKSSLADNEIVVLENKPDIGQAAFVESFPESLKSPVNHTDNSKSQNISHKDVFDDLFSEPPIFEKPKEPKKSRNINALFDDDSEDEALFFKKNDVVSDDIPEEYKTSQDNLFGVFRDEPPDVNLKADSDEDLFSALPKPNIPEATSEFEKSNRNIHTTLLRETKITKSDENVEKLKYSSHDDLFNTVSTNKPESKPTLLGVNIDKRAANILLDDEDLFKTPETKNNFSEINDDNLFSSVTQNKSVITELPKAEHKTDTLLKDDDLFKSKSIPKTAIRNHPVVLKTNNTFEDITQETHHEELFMSLPTYINSDFQKSTLKQSDLKPESPKKVGKLKTMNFNINVNALLPGSSPKKQKSLEGSSTESLDTTDDNKPEMKTTKAVNFESESSILDNKISKERAKIQVKRRPSTRRARIEAARKSGIDFGEDSTDNSSSIDDPPKHAAETVQSADTKEILPQSDNIEPKIIQPETSHDKNGLYSRDVKSKVVYILNDEDIFNTDTKSGTSRDIFNTDTKSDTTKDIPNTDTKPELTDNLNIRTVNKSEKSEKSNSIFDEEINKDQKERGIFDSDSDSELFSSKKEKKMVKEVKKGPLFSDDDEDGDLFGVKTKRKDVPIPQTLATTTAKEVAKTTEIVFDDPLSMLGDDE